MVDETTSRVCVWARTSTSSNSWTPKTTFGTEGGAADQFFYPDDIVVSSDGLTVWVADSENDRISIWTRPSADSTNWSPRSSFAVDLVDSNNDPLRIALSSDGLTLFVSESRSINIFDPPPPSGRTSVGVFTRSTTSSMTWTRAGFVAAAEATREYFDYRIYALGLSGDALTLWVGHRNPNGISIWSRPTSSSTTWTKDATFGGEAIGHFGVLAPTDIVVTGNGAWVSDRDNDFIAMWVKDSNAPDGWANPVVFGPAKDETARLNRPGGMAMTGSDRTMLVSECTREGFCGVGVWSPIC